MTIRIHHLRGSSQGKVQTFDVDLVRLGRNPDNDVCFHPTQDRTVSGHHAELVRQEGHWLYLDKGSSNGSWNDGTRVDQLSLAGGELIEIGLGGPQLKFELVEQAQHNKTAAHAGPAVARAAAQPAPSAVGSKTVAMMIQSALANSRDGNNGKVPTASFIKQVAGEAARHSSRTFKVITVVVIVVLCGAVAFLIWQLRRTEAEFKQELDEIALTKLGPSEIGEWIAQTNACSIYLLLYRTRLGFEQGFCTGFAVGADMLLTNAHCVAQAESLAKEGSTFFAAPNGGAGARYQISSWVGHPAYDAGAERPTADVGVMRVAGQLPTAVSLADAAHLGTLKPGAQIFVFGFPGDLNDVQSPVATLTQGVVGRMTTFGGKAGDASTQQLLQYSAFTTKGTSGSPVFDKRGRVVAVNSGYYQGKSRVRIEDPTTGEAEEANVSRDLSGYSFGIRIDLAGAIMGQ
ncbi:MAG: trypsin-like peptidase domain-containing protein [Deltaproteobacteria bacterium]|nr:trypsin-like peptidase domain-containing protein [Deltaproteobacteria bacterium]